jgi:mercuric ion transport protein
MKTIVGSVAAAVAASACCLGPVVFSLVGAGALGAAAARLEPLRPLWLTVTGAFLAAGFYITYRGAPVPACGPDGNCRPCTNRIARALLWIATAVVVLLVMFPYYMTWFI